MGRQRVVWSSGRTEGPVGAWIATAMRAGTTRSEPFRGLRDRLSSLGGGANGDDPFLTVLPGDGMPLPAEVRMHVVDRGPRWDPHLVLISVREYVDASVGLAPFDVAVHRALISEVGLEAVVTRTDLRVTWASPSFSSRAGTGDVLGRDLTEVTSAQERDALADLARQAGERRFGRPTLSRTLPTGRRVSVLDRRTDPAVNGLVWWWQPDTGALRHPDRLAAIEAAANRFVDELAWAGVDTGRVQSQTVGGFLPAHELTAREREILELLTSGLRVPSISARLFISQSTVRNHLSAAFKKLGVTSQAEFFERVAATSAPKRATRQRTRTARQPEP